MGRSEKNDPQGSYFHEKAEAIRNKMFDLLWDEQASFIKVLPMDSKAILRDVRELHGYTPWSFDLANHSYAIAWKFLMDKTIFCSIWSYNRRTMSSQIQSCL